MQAIDLGLVAMILDNSSAYENDLIDRCPLAKTQNVYFNLGVQEGAFTE